MSTEITIADYTARFIDHMVKLCGETFDDGSSIRAYATYTAPSYFDGYPEETPEESAESDMNCWGDDG